MARINLLDWRSAKREERKKQFTVWAGLGLLLAAAVVGSGYVYMDRAIEFQISRNNLLKQEIAAVEQKIKEIEELERVKQNLLSRMRVIEELQASRSATVHFFDEMVNALPEGVYLKSVVQRGSNVTVSGIAESNGRVSTYMRNLEASGWFDNPRLVVIRTTGDRVRHSDFELTVKILTKAKTGNEKESDSEVLE